MIFTNFSPLNLLPHCALAPTEKSSRSTKKMMSCLGPVTWLKNETSDKMYVSTINEFGFSEGREKVIPAGRRLVMRYRQGMDRSAEVRFRVRAEGRVDLENKEIYPYTVFECSDINIRYKLGDGSVVKNYADVVLLDFDLEKGTDDQVPRIGLFRWFRGCYDSCVALGKRCFAGHQEANDDVQSQAQDAEPPNPPIPQPVIRQVEVVPTIEAAQDPTISQHEMQHVISDNVEVPVQDEAMSVETSNSQIVQTEIQPVINGQAQAIPTTEVPNPPILQPVNNAQTEIILVAEAPDPLIPQLKILPIINDQDQDQDQAKAIHITETSNPPFPQPELQPNIKGEGEAYKRVVEAPDPPIQQPEIQLVINSILAAEALDPQIPQPKIQSFTNCQVEAIVEEPDPSISQSSILVINYQAEAILVAESPDPPIPQLVINCM